MARALSIGLIPGRRGRLALALEGELEVVEFGDAGEVSHSR